MSMTIRVAPEKLKSQAAAIADTITSIEEGYKKAEALALKYPAYREGAACEHNRQALSGLEEQAADVLKELREKPVRLLTMANIYEAAEHENQEAGRKLDRNIIS